MTTVTKTKTIRCISKDDRKNPYERIINVGGRNPNGNRWKQSQQKTVREIISGEWKYYVGEGRNRVQSDYGHQPVWEQVHQDRG